MKTIETNPEFYTEELKAAWLEHKKQIHALRRRFFLDVWKGEDCITPDAWLAELHAWQRSNAAAETE